MELNKYVLAQNMAFLLSLDPESNLAKLLKLCLVSHFNKEKLGQDSLSKAKELMENPENLPYWIQEIIQCDDKISEQELKAFGEMNLKQTHHFIEQLWQELKDFQV